MTESTKKKRGEEGSWSSWKRLRASAARLSIADKKNPKGKEAYYYKDRSRPNNWTEKINIPTNLALLIVQFQLRIPPDRQMALTLTYNLVSLPERTLPGKKWR